MKKMVQMLSRGAAIGLFAGFLFILLEITTTFFLAEVDIVERLYLFSSLYFGEAQVGTYNSFELTLSLLYHLLFSMVLGVVFVAILRAITRFSRWRATIFASIVMGVFFWLILFYFLEPMVLGSTLLTDQTSVSRQLLIQAAVFALFGIMAQLVFKQVD